MDDREPSVLPASFPFLYGWWGWELGDSRPCAGTYDLYAYGELPPLPIPDPTFAYLRADETPSLEHPPALTSEEAEVYDAEVRQKLNTLADEAAALGMSLPVPFVRFMSTPALRQAVDSPTGCWFSLADHLVPCPGFPAGRLVGFLRDQQDCIVWCLCLLPGGEYRVLALPSDIDNAMPSAAYNALLGQFDPEEDYDQWDREELEHPVARLRHTPEKVAEAIDGIRICADTFEDFIYRFWLESELYLNLHAQEINRSSKPLPARYLLALTAEELAYLVHYESQRQPENPSGPAPAR